MSNRGFRRVTDTGESDSAVEYYITPRSLTGFYLLYDLLVLLFKGLCDACSEERETSHGNYVY